jgi:uncharacterized membrane protein
MDETKGGKRTLKLWVPIVVGGVILLAYAFFYALDVTESQGATSFDLANSLGLVVVLVGVIAAGFVLRRGAPPS